MRKILLLLLAIALFSDVDAQRLQYDQNSYGREWNRQNTLYLLGLPKDTFVVPASLDTIPFIANKAGTIYTFNIVTKIWDQYSSGSGGGSGGGISQVGDGYGLNRPNDSTYNVDTLNIATRAWRQKGIDSVVSLLSQIPIGITQVVPGEGLLPIDDSTLKVDSTFYTTKADRNHLKDSLINVLNLRTIQQVLTAGNLITNPAQTIENDPSNTTGTFGIKQGVGGSTLGDLLVGYKNNRFINSNSSASYLAGFYSSYDTLTAFGSLRKAPSTGVGTLLNNAKWNYVVIDSNEVRMVADSINMTGRIKVSGQVRIGTVSGGIVTPSTSTQLPLIIARNSTGPNGLIGVYAYGPGLKAGSIGSITNQWLGLFTADQTDQVILMTNGATKIGRTPLSASPTDGLSVKGGTYLGDTLWLAKALVSSSTSDSVLVKSSDGSVKSAIPLSAVTGGGGSGTDNTNAGAGYRWLKPASQEIKTAFAGYGITIDSSSNTDGLTIIADTATLFAAVRATIIGGSDTNLGNSNLTQSAETRTYDVNSEDLYWDNIGIMRWYGSGDYDGGRLMEIHGGEGQWLAGRLSTSVYYEASDSLYKRGVSAVTDTTGSYVYLETAGGGTVKARAGAFVGGGGSPAGSNGQIQFNSSGSFGASSNLFWNNSNNRLGIGTSSPGTSLNLTSGSHLLIGSTTAPYSDLYNLSIVSADAGAAFVINLPSSDVTGRAFSVAATGEAYGRVLFYSNGWTGYGSGSATRDVFIGRSTGNTIGIRGAYNGTGTGNLDVNGNIITPGTEASTFRWNATATEVPSTTTYSAPTNYIGSSTSYALFTPDAWLRVNVAGTLYGIPAYLISTP